MRIELNKPRWYTEIVDKTTEISKEYSLSDEAKEAIQTFIMNVAREQYIMGNRAGMRWAREIIEE